MVQTKKTWVLTIPQYQYSEEIFIYLYSDSWKSRKRLNGFRSYGGLSPISRLGLYSPSRLISNLGLSHLQLYNILSRCICPLQLYIHSRLISILGLHPLQAYYIHFRLISTLGLYPLQAYIHSRLISNAILVMSKLYLACIFVYIKPKLCYIYAYLLHLFICMHFYNCIPFMNQK